MANGWRGGRLKYKLYNYGVVSVGRVLGTCLEHWRERNCEGDGERSLKLYVALYFATALRLPFTL